MVCSWSLSSGRLQDGVALKGIPRVRQYAKYAGMGMRTKTDSPAIRTKDHTGKTRTTSFDYGETQKHRLRQQNPQKRNKCVGERGGEAGEFSMIGANAQVLSSLRTGRSPRI